MNECFSCAKAKVCLRRCGTEIAAAMVLFIDAMTPEGRPHQADGRSPQFVCMRSRVRAASLTANWGVRRWLCKEFRQARPS